MCLRQCGTDKQKLTMPRNKTLSPLSDICTEWVLEWIFRNLNVYGTRQERIRQRLYLTSSLYSKIRQHLLILTFQQPLFQRNLTCKSMILELLGDHSTQVVDFSTAGLAYIDEVSYLYRILTLNQITNLTRLGITCNLRSLADKKCLPDVNSSFYPTFKQMKNLCWVTLVGVADKYFLATLGKNCPHLKYLNVAESLRVDDDAVASLLLTDPHGVAFKSIKESNPQDLPRSLSTSSLKVFCIRGTNVTSVGIAMILHCVPNFRSFEGDVDVGLLSKIIESLQPVNGYRSFNLKSVWDTRLVLSQAELIDRTCPHLTFLSTDASSLNNLHVLQSVSFLTLKLYYKNFVIDLYNYLLGCGRNLRKLVLMDHINSCLDLSWLIELTPNLEHLEATVDKEEDNNMLEWPCLSTAKVAIGSCETLIALMTLAPQLKDLNVSFDSWSGEDSFENIDDTLILKAVAHGGLQHLQRLWISKCGISLKGINNLLFNCPELMYLAPLAFWEGLSQDDLDSLRQRANENNWAFHFTLRTDWENGQKPIGAFRGRNGV